MNSKRILIIGLDGVGLDLVEQFAAQGCLPNLTKLMSRGIRSSLASTTPPMTLPAWTSFMTGAVPSSHGLPDFTIRSGYRVRFAGASSRRLPTLFSHLESYGLTASAAWFPATYPPIPLSGYHISGWDSPVTAKGDRSFVYPLDLHNELAENFGGDHLDFDTIDEFREDPDWYAQTAIALPKRIERRVEMAEWLIANRPTDITAFYFGEADTAAHHFWAFHDPNSPRRPDTFDQQLANTLKAVYCALDEAVGRLVKAANPGAVVLLSDHGSGGASNVAVHLNRMLESAGLLRFKKRSRSLVSTEMLRSKAPGMIPPAWRRILFRLAGGLAPAFVESQLRFSGIDWENTVAFSEELTYSPSVWFNQLGREPRGLLPARNRANAALAVEKAAMALASPDGSPLVKRVIRREDLHQGPYFHLFADLCIEFNQLNGYAPVCLPSRGKPGESVSVLKGAQLLGRKGRSLPGCHTPHGILIAAGRNIPENTTISANIIDVAPMVTALAGVPRAPWFEGRDIGHQSQFQQTTDAPYTAGNPPSSQIPGYSPSEERIVAERLKRLGYLE
jgi:predicted AlkP superfamily phosphohydrolase/phosphomutase